MKVSLRRNLVHFERVAASARHELYCTSCQGIFYSLETQRKERRFVSLFLTGLTKKSVSILLLEQHGLWRCHQFVSVFQQWGGSFIYEETKSHCSCRGVHGVFIWSCHVILLLADNKQKNTEVSRIQKIPNSVKLFTILHMSSLKAQDCILFRIYYLLLKT